MSLDTLLPKLEDPKHQPSATDLTALNHLGGAEHERFLGVWRSLSIQRRRDIIDLLADMAEDNVELDFGAVFMTGLLDDDVQVRAESIKALWEYEDDGLVEVLLRMLYDPEAIVRAEAALGLGRYLLRVELSGGDEARAREVESALRAKIDDESELVEVRGRALEAAGVRSEPWVHDAIDEASSILPPRQIRLHGPGPTTQLRDEARRLLSPFGILVVRERDVRSILGQL